MLQFAVADDLQVARLAKPPPPLAAAVPIQVHVRYTLPDGSQWLRVHTAEYPICDALVGREGKPYLSLELSLSP